MTTRHHTRTLLAIALVLATRAAYADPKSEAKVHFDRAAALHKEHKFAAALEELNIAYGLDPRPELLFAIAQLHVKLDRCDLAIEFYERFLSTRPDPDPEALAKEAIAHCRTRPPPVPTVARVESLPPPPAIAGPIVHEPLAATTSVWRRRAWYTDAVGDTLIAGAVVSGAVGALLYRAALADRDRAGSTTDYETASRLVESAHRDQTYAVVLGAASVACVAGAVVRFIVHDRRSEVRAVQIVPAPSGAAVTWMRRF
jgi:tetratricopeptide (TPR) repeat protein